MIDEYWTWQFYGYHSDELSYGSGKPIVAVCDGCYKYRISTNNAYREMCRSCARIGEKRPPLTDEHKRKISIFNTGIKRSPVTDEWRDKQSKSHIGKKLPPRSEEWCNNISKSKTGKKRPPMTNEARQHHSAGTQRISYDEWVGFSGEKLYCNKFDKAKREEIRVKYNHRCFICDKPQDENTDKNGKEWKLCVHHIDMNKDQGCNDHEWKLVPLCMYCHPTAHAEPMKSRIEYLRADEEDTNPSTT